MIDNGGPAFPQHVLNPTPESYSVAANNGMSLLDWFAGQALAGLVAHEQAYIGMSKSQAIARVEDMAYGCYVMARAMIDAKTKFSKKLA